MTRFQLPKKRDQHDAAVAELIAALWADPEFQAQLDSTTDAITGADDD